MCNRAQLRLFAARRFIVAKFVCRAVCRSRYASFGGVLMLLLKFRRFRLVGQPYAVWALVCFCLCALATATPAQTSTASLPPDRNRVELEAVDTWTDPLTGLMWAKKSSDQEVNWRQAIKYCKALQLGGYNDWYLPTIDELKPLFSVFENNWAVRGSQHLSGWNWSSSSAENGPGTVWSINLSPSGGVPNFSRDERGVCTRSVYDAPQKRSK